MQDDSEIILLEKVRAGDASAFERLYYAYSPKLYPSVIRMVKSTEVTEEILQELFQRVWEKREAIDTEKSFQSYLFTIAKHLVYDFFSLRTKQRHLEAHLHHAASPSYRHIDDEIAWKETQVILENGMLQLPPQRRLVYRLCKIEGKSYDDVSNILGISTSTISDHIVKATKAIKAYYLSEHAVALLLAIYSLSNGLP